MRHRLLTALSDLPLVLGNPVDAQPPSVLLLADRIIK